MKINNKRGIALIAAYMVIAVLSFLSAAFVIRSTSESRTIRGYENSNKAFWLAEAGIQKALWDINYNGCSQCCGVPYTACTHACSTPWCMQITADGYDVKKDGSTIISTATVGEAPSPRVTRTIQVTLGTGTTPKPFTSPIFGNSSIHMYQNALTDSYDSLKGPYEDQLGANRSMNGSVGTNGSMPGVVTIDNNSYIYGMTTTVGGTVEKANGAYIYCQACPLGGEECENDCINNLAKTRDLPLIDAPDELKNALTEGPYTVLKSASAILPMGDHRYDSINIGIGGTLNVSGKTRLYLTAAQAIDIGNNGVIHIMPGASLTIYTTGSANLGNNGLFNDTQFPKNFILYSTYSGPNVMTISNNVDWYGAIYAPNTNITITNNGRLFGAIVGNNLNVFNNAQIHFDEQLQTVTGTETPPPSEKPSITSWQECKYPDCHQDLGGGAGGL